MFTVDPTSTETPASGSWLSTVPSACSELRESTVPRMSADAGELGAGVVGAAQVRQVRHRDLGLARRHRHVDRLTPLDLLGRPGFWLMIVSFGLSEAIGVCWPRISPTWSSLACASGTVSPVRSGVATVSTARRAEDRLAQDQGRGRDSDHAHRRAPPRPSGLRRRGSAAASTADIVCVGCGSHHRRQRRRHREPGDRALDVGAHLGGGLVAVLGSFASAFSTIASMLGRHRRVELARRRPVPR